MKRRTRFVLLLGVLALIALGVTGWWMVRKGTAESTLTLYGNVDIREVALGFRVPGRLLEMDFDEGDSVTAGTRVARLDPEPYREALAVAEARVEQARAQLDKLESGSRPQEVQQATARVREVEVALDNAQRSYRRKLGLLDSGASSEREVEAARSQRDELEARLESAREALALAEEGFREQDVAIARAELAAARAQRDQTETQLADTDLVSPSDGVVLTRVHEPGAMLAQGSPVYTLSLRDPVYVRAYVAEPDLGRVVPGAEVRVITDSSPESYRGQIGFVSPRAEFTPKTVQTTELRTDLVYRLRIVVSDADDGLRQGMPVTVEVPLDRKED